MTNSTPVLSKPVEKPLVMLSKSQWKDYKNLIITSRGFADKYKNSLKGNACKHGSKLGQCFICGESI